MTIHARFSASSSARWLGCPASMKMTEGLNSSSSAHAREGTCAHELGERCLKTGDPTSDHIGKVYEGIEVTKEMADYIQGYVDYVNKHVNDDSILVIEETVSYANWVPDGFGTADAIVVDGDTMHIIDLKYGQGVRVSPIENTQGMLYALGAYEAFRWMGDINYFVIHIYQPRIDNIASWKLTLAELLKFAEYAQERAQLCLTDDAPFGPSDKACQWCQAKSKCPALAKHSFEVIANEFDDITENAITIKDLDTKELVAIWLKEIKNTAYKIVGKTLDPARLGYIMNNAPLIRSWLTSIESEALKLALNDNVSIPRFKLVRSNTNRKFNDEGKAKLEQMLGDAAYKKTLRSPSDLEKELGKEEFKKTLGDYVIKPEGKLTLAPMSDRRKEATQCSADDFDNVD